MTLTVLSVASPLLPVGQDQSGTAEQVLSAIDVALMRGGHDSIVVARAGSSVAGTLLPLPADAHQDGGVAVRAAVAEALARHPVDLVHLHGDDFARYLPPAGLPVLVTLHQPLDRYPAAALTPSRPGTHLHGLSEAQGRAAPPGVRLLPPIEPGVPIDRLFIRVPKRRFVVGLGRIEPESGFHLAFDAARQADMQLVLGGERARTAETDRYWQDEIHPRLDGRRRYLGSIGFARKRWMLGAARCLLAPSLDGEAAGLAALEALACGTPVVGFPTGALVDIIDPGVTGFLVRSVEEMAEAIGRAETIDPEACRAAARARYSQDAMIARYFSLYGELAGGQEQALGASMGVA